MVVAGGVDLDGDEGWERPEERGNTVMVHFRKMQCPNTWLGRNIREKAANHQLAFIVLQKVFRAQVYRY